ncbi:hypothetical protein Z948_1917 [Sulfitobacter donghicola DSW-25 = KCTC 12864 = JCM 14565]|nr:hypothetical protein Z948_1917 [Sulfitobacter donghicola DSW-25 = KCTC 12864 = JCM 14565]
MFERTARYDGPIKIKAHVMRRKLRRVAWAFSFLGEGYPSLF